jgi:hypothetical protein
MEITAGTQPADASVAESERYELCEQCEAPLEQTQRYCVVCGARRKHHPDPAGRFMAAATSRMRATGAEPAARMPTRGSRRRTGLGTAAAIAVVPVAVALGVLVGRAGNGTDANLLAALRAQKAEVVNIGGGTAAASGVTTAGRTGNHRVSRSGSGTGKALSTTKYGTFRSVAGLSRPSQATLNQSAQVVQHVQRTINKSYVDSQKNLPNVIAVP